MVGTGYVGLVTGTCFADMGNDVICLDVDEKKINNLKNGIMPIFEPGLKELVERNHKDGRLKFTTDKKEAYENSDIIFICVPTPMFESGECDLSIVKKVADELSQFEEVKDKVEKFFIKTSNQEKNVKLKNSEVETLKEKLGEKGFLFCVNKLSDYKLAKGATYKSDYGAINSWVIKEWEKQQINGKEKLTGAQAFLKQFEQ